MLCFGGIKAWEALRIMSKEACRPFCKNRDGMVKEKVQQYLYLKIINMIKNAALMSFS